MKPNYLPPIIAAVLALAFSGKVMASQKVDSIVYNVGVIANASTGSVAPYMIAAWTDDRIAMKNAAFLDAAVLKPMSVTGRFSWGAGAEILTGYRHSVDYARYDIASKEWGSSVMKPAAFSIRRLFAEAHYRSLYALVGMKEFSSPIVDGNLSSGDLVLSNNARPIPGVTIGFVDFQNIPFINGWVQINGKIMYGKFADNDFRRSQFNYYSEMLATDLYYTYKYCYFRTKPSERFSATFGMQTAGQFGGQTARYYKGALKFTDVRGFHLKDIVKMFFPMQGNGNAFYEGNSLGSWSLRARYRLKDNSEIAVYWESPFEDGSAIGLRNGADGLYGVQFSLKGGTWFRSAVVEYLDFRNQSGPIHYAPGDHKNPSITSEATGGDNYYNNDSFGPYTNYGMSIGSAMLVAPFYNADGYPEFLYNRLRGAHFALTGQPESDWSYKLMLGWQKGYANGRKPLPVAKSNFSAMAQLTWDAGRYLTGLNVSAKLAFDRGDLRGDNFGAALSVTYVGSFNINRK